MGLYYNAAIDYGIAVKFNEETFTVLRKFYEHTIGKKYPYDTDEGERMEFEDVEYLDLNPNLSINQTYIGEDPWLFITLNAVHKHLDEDDVAPIALRGAPEGFPLSTALLNKLATAYGTEPAWLFHSTYS